MVGCPRINYPITFLIYHQSNFSYQTNGFFLLFYFFFLFSSTNLLWFHTSFTVKNCPFGISSSVPNNLLWYDHSFHIDKILFPFLDSMLQCLAFISAFELSISFLLLSSYSYRSVKISSFLELTSSALSNISCNSGRLSSGLTTFISSSNGLQLMQVHQRFQSKLWHAFEQTVYLSTLDFTIFWVMPIY